MIWFQLGREYKLSIAEILAVFPEGKTVYFSKDFLILNNLEEREVLEKCDKLWWTIKIIKILENTISEIAKNSEWKYKYWLSVFWEKKNLKAILVKQKKDLQQIWISSRFINKDFKNLTSAQILWEKLLKSFSDFTYIYSNDKVYFWVSIWVQNIFEYSKRDYSKDRDMQTGMLPPKLCQIMINLSNNITHLPLGTSLNTKGRLQESSLDVKGSLVTKWKGGINDWNHIVYDPFVWLWTVLIESINMWNKKVYWSDLSERMVEKSTNNINSFINKFTLIEWNLETDIDFLILKLNAKFIEESKILLEKKIDSIVTEWYLWEIMTQKNISLDRIDKQKKSLLELYNRFFEWLTKINYSWNLVICFPFWEINWKYIYFIEIYDVINKYCIIQALFPESFKIDTTKVWSLLYKREKQLVWREIFKLKIKYEK